MKKQISYVQRLIQRCFNPERIFAGGTKFQRKYRSVLLTSFFITISLVTVHAQSCPPIIQWQKSLGGSLNDGASTVLVTTDGGYFLAGYSNSNDGDVSGNHGNADSWAVKLAADNSITWQASLGGPREEVAHDAVQTSDDGYIIAGSSHSDSGQVFHNHGKQDFWIVKLNANGNLIWQNALGGTENDVAYSVSQTDDGGCIVAGITYSVDSDVTFNHGLDDYWIVKLDADGNMSWQKTFGGSGSDEAYSIKQTTDGGYIVSGFSDSNDGDVTGNHGLEDYWIVKMDISGNLLWEKSFGGSQNDVANCVRQTSDGGYVVAGYTFSDSNDVTVNHGFSDYWILKLDASGNLIWQNSFGGSDYDQAFAIEQTMDGGYITAGHTASHNFDVTLFHGNVDFWLTKQDAGGNFEWQKTLGGTDQDGAFSIKETPDTGFIVAGYSGSNNDDVSGNHGSIDMWVVKLHDDSAAVITYYADVDGDGYGDPNNSIDTASCTPPAGYVTDNNDCNDNNQTIHPNATEVCNGIDDDCNDIIDDGVLFTTYYFDADGDSYGNSPDSVTTCSGAPAGYVLAGNDCNDADPAIHPGATELCNGIDDNCNNSIDDGVVFTTYYADADGDSYGNSSNSVSTCDGAPAGYVANATDCDDANPSVHPGAAEVCNGVDDDCNLLIDDGLIFTTYYADADGDQYGNSNSSLSTCNGQPAGYVPDANDCNDANSSVHPNATEICNSVDDDCNLLIDDGLVFATYFIDADNDTYGNPLVSASTCNGAPSGYVTDSTDCDDSNPNVNPGAQEIANNGIDDNCNNEIDEFGVGIDGIEGVSSLLLFPNPASNLITIQLQLQTSSSLTAEITIINVLGKTMFERTSSFINGTLDERIALDEKFAGGMYYVKISSGQQQWTKSLVVLK